MRNNPSSKVAAMASMFQQPTEKHSEEKTKPVKKGRQSLPVYGEAGFSVSKHKIALRRSNSQKDRFSSARNMFVNKDLGAISASPRLSVCSSISSNGSVDEAEIVDQGDKEDLGFSNSCNGFSDIVEHITDPCKSNVKVVNKNENDSDPDESRLHKENLFNTHLSRDNTDQKNPETFFLSPNRQIKDVGQVQTEAIACSAPTCNKSPLLNSTPPPLPSLPPPSLLSGDGKSPVRVPTLLAEGETLLDCTRTQPDPLDIGRKLSFSLNTVEDSPNALSPVTLSQSEDMPVVGMQRNDSLSDILEYSALCESLASVEYQKFEEEFARLTELTDDSHAEDLKYDVSNDHKTEETSCIVSPDKVLAETELNQERNFQVNKPLLSVTEDRKENVSYATAKSRVESPSSPAPIISIPSAIWYPQSLGTESDRRSTCSSALSPSIPAEVVPGKFQSEVQKFTSPICAQIQWTDDPLPTPVSCSSFATPVREVQFLGGSLNCEGQLESTPFAVGVDDNQHDCLDSSQSKYSKNLDGLKVAEDSDAEQVTKSTFCHSNGGDEIKTKTPTKTLEEKVESDINKSSTTSEAGMNTSSLGSSLVGQSVSSWLATSGSISADSLLSAENSVVLSPKIAPDSDKFDSSKFIQQIEESSDYISGDSCELAPPSSVKLESKTALESFYDEETKVHYFGDGNYWYEGPPLFPTSLLDDTSTTSQPYIPPSRVKFSSSPVRLYSTYSAEEYDRRNDDIDPAAATAEYELEKRVENMETFEVNLNKVEGGLGLSILGMGVGAEAGVDKLGIFIKAITPGKAAEINGRIQVTDQIISVDGSCLVGVTQVFAASVLRNTEGEVKLVIGREKNPGDSEVAQLIQQSVQADLDMNDLENLGSGTVEGYESSEDDSLSKSLCMEGQQSVCSKLEKEDSGCGEQDSTMSPLQLQEDVTEENDLVQYKQCPEAVPDYGQEDQADVLREVQVVSTGLEVEDNFDDGGEDFTDSCTTEREVTASFKPNMKSAGDEPSHCCSHEESYNMLSAKYQQAQERICQMERNMSIVTEQLVSRDQLYSAHMNRLRTVFSQLEEQLQDTNRGADLAFNQQSLGIVLEPRGALRRKPFIPSNPAPSPDNIPPHSVLDQAIPPTPLLDTTLARDRVSLVHRGTLARRRGRGMQNTYTISVHSEDAGSSCTIPSTQTDTSSAGEMYTKAVEKEGGAAALQDQLRKRVKDFMGTQISDCKVEDISSTPSSLNCKASSLPNSPSVSMYSSSSSLQSVPDVPAAALDMKKEKKKKWKSAKSLLNLARRFEDISSTPSSLNCKASSLPNSPSVSMYSSSSSLQSVPDVPAAALDMKKEKTKKWKSAKSLLNLASRFQDISSTPSSLNSKASSLPNSPSVSMYSSSSSLQSVPDVPVAALDMKKEKKKKGKSATSLLKLARRRLPSR
eukprot:GFUD01034591.1.p1 GENE.GFUD01034591.1~~GFUD01034591.1.p1  ORF type:complete len:1440 (-),score=419.17 GFUD01034591.1:124-4395(-)